MDPDAWNYDRTSLHPGAALALIVCSLLVLFLRRERVIIPFLLAACFISLAQRINIFNLDFTILRLMLLVAAVRIFIRGEYAGFTPRAIDYVFVLWLLARALAYCLLHGQIRDIINQSGVMYDALGTYFLCRMLYRDKEDVLRTGKYLAILSLPVMIFFVIEWQTGQNPFAIFGGVPAESVFREGRIRCQGAYSHPIMAGCFWATALVFIYPLMRRERRFRLFAVLSFACIAVILAATASSTPILAAAVGVFGGLLYLIRRHMPILCGLVLLALFCLHIAMRAPVWHLLARVGVVGGSTGYHRYNLVNAFIERVPEWILLGVRDTTHWGWGLFDVTNQFVYEGVKGGGLGLLLFVLLLFLLLRGLRLRSQNCPDTEARTICWCLWTALFMQCFIFFSVSYFGQILLLWYLLLAVSAGMIYNVGEADEPEQQPDAPLEPPDERVTQSPWRYSPYFDKGQHSAWHRKKKSQS